MGLVCRATRRNGLRNFLGNHTTGIGVIIDMAALCVLDGTFFTRVDRQTIENQVCRSRILDLVSQMLQG